MKTQIKLTLIGMQFLPDGAAVLITKPSATNPSANGNHIIKEGQLKRICLRAGLYNPDALKALIELSNGSAQLIIDSEDLKAGDTFKNKVTGETGTYTKDWTRRDNHEVILGVVAKMKIAERALDHDIYERSYSRVSAPVAHVEATEDVPKV
jgi:hypothetical protein